jgi:hypothetical protein
MKVDHSVTGADAKAKGEVAHHSLVGVLAVNKAHVWGLGEGAWRQITSIGANAHKLLYLAWSNGTKILEHRLL